MRRGGEPLSPPGALKEGENLMSARIATLLVALAALAVGGRPARADDAAARQQIQEIYNKVAEAVKKKDPTPAAGYIAEDFKERDVFGKVHSVDEVRERFRQNMEKVDN